MRIILLLLSGLCTGLLTAQPDAYHSNLTNWLSTQYTLTGETYPTHDSEVENFSASGGYGMAQTSSTVSDQDFTRILKFSVPGGLLNPWDAGWNISNTQPVNIGDKVLWVIYLRVSPTEAGNTTGQVSLICERNDTYEKEVSINVELTETWKRYFIAMDISTRNHPVGGLTTGLHLGSRQQSVEVGGFALLNYGNSVPLDQLPSDLNNAEYGGFEADAAWRAPAADRIESIRKSDLELTVLDVDGNPMAAADVQLRMQRHAFDFGTAIKACRFPGGRCYNPTYVSKLFDLDGRGHGFSAVVYENDLKWPAWEDEWVSTNEQTIRNMQFLSEMDIDVRGHVLLWPGWSNMPDRMEENRNNPDYLKGEIEKHLVDFLETKNFDQYVTDWDVLNEVNTNTDLAAALRGTPGYTTGREIYAEVFKRARELAPDAELYINDYITMSLKNTSGALYNQYKSFIQEMLDQGAPMDGVGFQAHLGASPNSIYDILGTLDDFHEAFGLQAKITEFDLPRNVPEELAADYLADFLTATFSHESVESFMFWNFWDVDTWANPGANLYDGGFNETPAHAAFVDLVFNEWWTDADLTTDNDGKATVRGFKGTYEVTLDCNGESYVVAFDMNDDLAQTIDCSALVSTTLPTLPEGSVEAYPNPGRGPWTINNHLPTTLDAVLIDGTGRKLWSGQMLTGNHPLDLDLPAGVYHLQLTDGTRASSLRLIQL